MSNVKKAFIEIANLLNENSSKKVSTILPQLMELMTSKGSGGSDIGKTFLKDENGEVFAIFCYYHKKWELISECEYGSKKGTATNLNTMCKEGVSNWTKQQRKSKKAQTDLLSRLASGDLEQADLTDEMAAIEEAKDVIIPREDGQGADTVDEIQA